MTVGLSLQFSYIISLGAIGVSLNKQKLMYNILAPSIIAMYKFLCTYGGSVYIYNGTQMVIVPKIMYNKPGDR